MGRYYRLAKTITEQMASEILQEILEMEQVEKAEFLEDNSKILVKTKEEDYPAVMTKIVNIFRRVGNGCDLSFAGFEHP